MSLQISCLMSKPSSVSGSSLCSIFITACNLITSTNPCLCVCQSVCRCVFVCHHDNSKSYWWIWTKFCGMIDIQWRINLVDFGPSKNNTDSGALHAVMLVISKSMAARKQSRGQVKNTQFHSYKHYGISQSFVSEHFQRRVTHCIT